MIAAVYARRSTVQDDVAEEAKSVTRQVDGARAFITAKGWTLDERHIYVDDGVSGARFLTRPEFQRLLRDAEAKAFDAVVFYDLDRFGRQARHTMAALWMLDDLDITIWDSAGRGEQVDLASMGGRVTVTMRAEVAQAERERTSARNTDAAWHKARSGYVAGGAVFGYHNTGPKGQRIRCINDTEASVVRDIFERYANGEGLRTIALALNRVKAPSPRAQQGRPSGWSSSSVREVLMRPLYRGEVVFGRTTTAEGRDLRKVHPKTIRETGQIPCPEDSWFRSEQWADRLRIINADLAARVDARREEKRRRYVASTVQRGTHVPERAHGKYLLSGGLLRCPTCSGHFEAVKAPWRKGAIFYVCSTRRRKPGTCANTLSVPMAEADAAVLDMVEGEVLGTRFIEELLTLVDSGEEDNTAQLKAERDRLQQEVQNLVNSIAAGVPADTVAPAIKDRQRQIAKLETQLRQPRPVQPKIDELRAALEQRAAEWRQTLRAEPKVARLLLRRLIGPLTLTDPSDHAAFDEWATFVTPALLEGLGLYNLLASPTGFEPVFWP